MTSFYVKNLLFALILFSVLCSCVNAVYAQAGRMVYILPLKNRSNPAVYKNSAELQGILFNSLYSFISYIPGINLPEKQVLEGLKSDEDSISNTIEPDYIICGSYILRGNKSNPMAMVTVRILGRTSGESFSNTYTLPTDMTLYYSLDLIDDDLGSFILKEKSLISHINFNNFKISSGGFFLKINDRSIAAVTNNDFNLGLVVLAGKKYHVEIVRALDSEELVNNAVILKPGGSTNFSYDDEQFTVGSLWVKNAIPSKSEWSSVTYGNDVFAAVSYGSSDGAVSRDGSSWSAMKMPLAASWSTITCGGGVFIAVSQGDDAAYSTDGSNWTAVKMPEKSKWCSAAYGGSGVFVALSDGTNAALSHDGSDWTAVNMPVKAKWRSIAWGNGVFVATSSGNIAATSPDGFIWTPHPIFNGDWRSVAFGNGIFTAVAYHSSCSVATSPDGVTWTKKINLDDHYGFFRNHWNSIAFGNGAFVAVAVESSAAAASSSGLIWQEISFPESPNRNTVAYGNGIYVAVFGKGDDDLSGEATLQPDPEDWLK